MCKLCNLEHLTDWYFWDKKKGIVVCKDLKSLGYYYRLLCVCMSLHKAVYNKEETEMLENYLMAVVNAHLVNNPKLKFAGIDFKTKSIKEHYHIQAMFRRKQ